MEKGYLIDTSVVIGYLDNKIPLQGMRFLHPVVDAIPYISVITNIEVLKFDASNDVYKTLTDFINESAILDLNDMVVDTTISICKAHYIKLPNAVIAATALVHNLTLITRNIPDFENICGLKLLNPWDYS